MIEAKQVSLRYADGTIALKNIDLQVAPGDMVYITGPSGSGKTSLLKLMMGIEYPTSGVLKVLGKTADPDSAADFRRLRRMMGPVFQEFKLIDGRTAIENVILGMRFIDIPSREMNMNAMYSLEKVGLGRKAQSLVETLSWGERQRVAIARAVARKPLLILADEPTGNLDRDNALNILDLLDSFRSDRTAVVITTHATHLIEDKDDATKVQIENGCMCLGRWR